MSCGNENPVGNGNSDNYYVKYEVVSHSIYIVDRTVQINLENNENGSFTFKDSPWEMTIGPIKKGFNARLKANYTSSVGNSYINARIYISKNSEPFSLKKNDDSDSPRTSVEINYIIN